MCSRCGRTIKSYGNEELLSIRYPYCHCGADMRGYTEEQFYKGNQKFDSEIPVEVILSSNRINVTFNGVDIDRIQKFIGALERTPCVYTQQENEFEIRANGTTLYMILLYLTDEYEEIALF